MVKYCSGGERSGRGCWGQSGKEGAGVREEEDGFRASRCQGDDYTDYGKGTRGRRRKKTDKREFVMKKNESFVSF